MNAADPRHATNAGYIAGCRHDCCRAAHATYKRNRRARLYLARTDALSVPALGTTRRIRALMAMGWRLSDMDTHLGQRPRYTFNLTDQERVHTATAGRVAAMYDDLCMTPGPSSRTRARALRSGWRSPLAWDDIDHDDAPAAVWQPRGDDVDENVILRVLDGERLPATTAERREIMRRWTAAGRSEKSLCDRMGWRDGRYGMKAAS